MRHVLIIDDHRTLADSVAFALRHNQQAIVSTIDIDLEGPDAIRAARPDACLLDLELGADRAGGLAYLEAAVAARIPAAMFTGCSDPVRLGRCIELGAVGIISKHLAFEEMLERVGALLEGESLNSDTEVLEWVLALQRHRQDQRRELAPFEALTPREQVVLAHLMTGAKVDEIAETDFVSVATVRTQIRAVLQKLGVTSQLAAVAAAYQAGWRHDDEPAPLAG